MSSNLNRLRPLDFAKVLRSDSRIFKELKRVDPKDRYVLLYPHSENVHVGLGFNLLNSEPAEQIFANASKILNKDILRLCLEGPKSELLSLENRHIAAYVTSHATVAKLTHENPHLMQFCKAAAGIEIGLINTLVFSGAMSFQDGLDLVQKQAQAMERASKIVPSAKLRIRLRPATSKVKVCLAAREHCLRQNIPEEVAVCSVTKQISPQVIEISGHEEAINYLEVEGARLFEFYHYKRVVRNPLAYHTELMRPASEYLRLYIQHRLKENPEYIREPESSSIYSATAGCRLRHLHQIKKDLYDHPVKSLKIEQLLHCIYDRQPSLAQPNTLVVWDKSLLRNLLSINRKAWSSAKLLKA